MKKKITVKHTRKQDVSWAPRSSQLEMNRVAASQFRETGKKFVAKKYIICGKNKNHRHNEFLISLDLSFVNFYPYSVALSHNMNTHKKKKRKVEASIFNSTLY